MSFVGRQAELEELSRLFADVERGGRADQGIAVLLRGRRRVGKSRLATEFVDRSGVPSVYFQAARGAPSADEFALLAEAIAGSTLPGAEIATDNVPGSLTAALTLLAAALPTDTPSIVVIDEAPWLLEGIDGGAGELQRVWDRQFSAKPVLLLLLGSDLAMMEELAKPNQPFHGRATEIVLEALNPRDVGRMIGLSAFDSFDAYLITGGQPLVAQEWHRGMTRDEFLLASLSRSTSALVVSGTRVLDSEFGESTHARTVLSAIGGKGERTFTGIHQSMGGAAIAQSTLSASLASLAMKRVVVADEPLSTKAATKDRRWRIADPALRFWLAFVEPALGEIDRGRPDLAMARVKNGYESWRGRAIEPVVRSALERLLPDTNWPHVARVGGWWPRSNTPEIDLIGVDRVPASAVSFVGTIKWREKRIVTSKEIAKLAKDAVAAPGVDASSLLVAVCPAGRISDKRITQTWTAADLLEAWH
jgi:AAA+ ATPase superfamily predicted ATPase